MLALLRNLFTTPAPTAAGEMYIALVERARNPFFYEKLAVPDTLDGRFELLVLHLFLLQHRLIHAADKVAAEECSRQLSEQFFADMDRSLREIGVADTGVRYRIKAMAKAYHGRLQAYTVGVNSPGELPGALARNLYGTVAEGSVALLEQAGEYVLRTVQALASLSDEAVLAGNFSWPAL